MRLVRQFSFLTLVCFLGLGLGVSSCEQQAEKDFGIQAGKDPATGKPTVTVDPSGGPVGSVVKTVGAVAETAFPGPGTLASIALNGALAIIVGLLTNAAKNRQGQLDTKTAALNDANVALNATATGLQQIVNTLPADHAATVAHILDLTHDAANVAGHLQDLIQPKLDTAGSGAPTPAPADPAPKPA